MRYKGQELVEVTEPQVFIPPKKMCVWDNALGFHERKVCSITKCEDHLVALTFGEGGFMLFQHCAEIPEEPKPSRATNCELARWLAQGNGQCRDRYDKYVHILFNYKACDEDEPVSDEYLVRKWDDTGWHEPTVDYLGLEADR